jgi:hypothetical protein
MTRSNILKAIEEEAQGERQQIKIDQANQREEKSEETKP